MNCIDIWQFAHKYMKNTFKNKYKDVAVQDTIKIILDILAKHDICIEQNWKECKEIGTFSVRIKVKGTQIGTNGKGVTRELAFASGLAELLERVQNGFLNVNYSTRIDDTDGLYNFQYMYDEKSIDFQKLIAEKDPILSNIIKRFDLEGSSHLIKLEKTYELFGENSSEKIVTIPYVNVFNNDIQNLPYKFVCSIYGTNGMCAGNTMEEALVQGFSEIFERNVQKKILSKEIIPKRIEKSNKILNNELYRTIEVIEKQSKYTVELLDCTDSGRVPVIGILIKSNKSNRFGIKFGAHPDFNIAVERTLTEATQGQDIEEFVERNSISFSDKEVLSKKNICNTIDVGFGVYPHTILIDKSFSLNYLTAFNSNISNAESLSRFLAYFTRNNLDIFIRDSSFLGFPTYQIIIPNFSEIEDFDFKEYQMHANIQFLSQYLEKPSTISQNNVKEITYTCLQMLNFITFNRLSYIYSRKDELIYPFSNYGVDMLFFISICLIYSKDYHNAVKLLGKIKAISSLSLDDNEIIEMLNLILEAKINKINNDDICDVLSGLYDGSKYKKYMQFMEKGTIIKFFYPDDLVTYPTKTNEDYYNFNKFTRKISDEAIKKNFNQTILLKQLENYNKRKDIGYDE